MRNECVQMTLWDIYNGVSETMEEQKPELIRLLEEHIDFTKLIPDDFNRVFYCRMGRSHIFRLESFVRALVIQKLLRIYSDALLITILRCRKELRDFCGFSKVPDASQFSRFCGNFCDQLAKMFEYLVDQTEPIYREINGKKADYLIYDTTGLALAVAENNPKFFNTKLKEAKKFFKTVPGHDPYKGVYFLLPSASKANPDAKQQYINGHFCYATKLGIVTNGLGICRHIAFFDDAFHNRHPEIEAQCSDNPDEIKELGDSTSLKPILTDFFYAHPNFSAVLLLATALLVPMTTTLC